MDPSDISVISVISGLGLVGSVYAWVVIPRKGFIFWLIISLFVAASVQTITQYFRKISDAGSAPWWAANVVTGAVYCYLFFFVNYLYAVRLHTLGQVVHYETLAKYMPWLILAMAALNFIAYLVYVATSFPKEIYATLSSTFLAVALVCEVYVIVVLIRKVESVFLYNQTTVSRWLMVKTKVYLAVIIFLEVGIFALRVFVTDPRSPEGSLRVLGFVIRVIVIIDFFRDLLKCLIH